jgi:hypothetical protein
MNGNETSGGVIGDIVKVIAQKYQRQNGTR